MTLQEIKTIKANHIKTDRQLKESNDLDLTESEYVQKYHLPGWFISKKAWREDYREMIKSNLTNKGG